MSEERTATPHIAPTADIAKVVLMPGDPLRAKYVAEHFLEAPVCFNTVRNMYGYTGTYKGKMVSVMGHGMGIPSCTLYATELFTKFGVEAIIRIGSAGAIADKINLGDVLIAMGASTDSSYGTHFGFPGTWSALCDYDLMHTALSAAEQLGIPAVVGHVFSSDFFYTPDPDANRKLAKFGISAVEMEAAGLYWVADYYQKRALTILTASDHILRGESMPAETRQTSFTDMMKVALETALTVAD